MRVVLVATLLVAACAETDSTRCGSLVCPGGTTCVALPALTACASQDQRDACKDKAENAACEPTSHPPGFCHGGACLPPICGDGLVDPGEGCDIAASDGAACTPDCRSDLSCGNGLLDPGEICDDSNPYSHDACSAECKPEIAVWTERQPGSPEGLRTGHAMAFDGVRGTTLMFGGQVVVDPQTTLITDHTYEWDGSSWFRLDPLTSPAARIHHAMAYDAARGRIVLFGGNAAVANSDRRDTWEWDGARWSIKSPATLPDARSHHAMAYDAVRKQVIMFGGGTGDGIILFGGTWVWDGTDWTAVSGTTPPPRVGHAMAFDAARGEIVMFGGRAGTTTLRDTWVWNGTSWTERVLANRPLSREGAAMAFDGTHIVMIAGNDKATQRNDMWLWDGQSWTIEGVTQLDGGLGAAFDPRRGRIVVYAQESGATQGTFEWDPALEDGYRLQPADTLGPIALFGAAGTSSTRGRAWVFGGCATGAPNACSGSRDTLELIGGGWRIAHAGTFSTPSGRALSAIGYHEGRRRLVVFGGLDSNGTVLGDSWSIDPDVDLIWTQDMTMPLPPARVQHAMAYDAARDNIVLFGGTYNLLAPAQTLLGDTWVWNGGWTQVTGDGPDARFGHALAYDPKHQRVVLFGGCPSTSAYLSDTWEWNGTSWKRLDATGPTGRCYASLTWSHARQRLVLIGGEAPASTELADVWELDGSTWTELIPAPGPTPRSRHVTLTTNDGHGVAMHGGLVADVVVSSELWFLRFDSSTPHDQCRDDSDSDDDLLRGCDDPDCWMSCTPTCPPVIASCMPEAPYCGDGACLGNENCLCPADCSATCAAVCGDNVCELSETMASCPGDCTPP